MNRLQYLFCLAILLSLFLLPHPAPALAETAEKTSSDSMERLAVAVENLAQLLQQESASQEENTQLRKLDIAISYLNFRSRRIERLDRDLNLAKNDRDRLEDVLHQWQEHKEQLKNDMEDQSDQENKESQQTLLEIELREKSVKKRQVRLEEEIIILENRIIDLQSQLDAVEDYVQRHLQL